MSKIDPIALKARMLAQLDSMLDEYCAEAAEHEDESTFDPNEPIDERLSDFVAYFISVDYLNPEID